MVQSGSTERALNNRPFPQEVILEANKRILNESLFAGRRSVRGVTIDGPFSRDLDDAVWLEKLPEGKFKLDVSIVDVSSLVTPGSLLDQEAYLRTSTRYFAQGNNPMIPHGLSEDTLSLRQGELRPTVTVSVVLDDALDVESFTIDPTMLTNERKLSYEQVDQTITNPNHPLSTVFKEYYEVASLLLTKRRARGALAIYDIFRGIATTEEGLFIDLKPQDRHKANIIIQESMIIANKTVAQFCADKDIPVLFRNHRAKVLAPERKEMMRDIENTLKYPEQFSLDTLRQRVGLSLERAYYGPDLAGHYGLNLPAYLHFTSPIRRYADLINQRILLAALRGEPSPYTFEQLQDIGSYITKVEREVKDARNQREKDKRYVVARAAVAVNRVILLDPDDFSRSIKVASRENKLTEEITEQILVRLRRGKLGVNDLFVLLLEPKPDSAGWEPIHAEVLQLLRAKPEYATSLAVMAKQLLKWPDITFESSFKGPDHARMFSAVAKIVLDGKEYASETAQAKNQKIAQHLATVNLLSQVVSVNRTVVQADIRQLPQFTTVAERGDKTTPISYKNVLLEASQAGHCGLPSYTVKQSGPPNSPTFKAVAEVPVGTKIFRSGETTGSTKTAAEQAAARSLLAQLNIGSVEQLTKEPKKVEVDNGNFIGSVQTLTQRNHWDLPEYRVTQSGPDHAPNFKCIVKITKPDGTVITAEATGKNNKDAKQNAAELVFKKL